MYAPTPNNHKDRATGLNRQWYVQICDFVREPHNSVYSILYTPPAQIRPGRQIDHLVMMYMLIFLTDVTSKSTVRPRKSYILSSTQGAKRTHLPMVCCGADFLSCSLL